MVEKVVGGGGDFDVVEEPLDVPVLPFYGAFHVERRVLLLATRLQDSGELARLL